MFGIHPFILKATLALRTFIIAINIGNLNIRPAGWARNFNHMEIINSTGKKIIPS